MRRLELREVSKRDAHLSSRAAFWVTATARLGGPARDSKRSIDRSMRRQKRADARRRAPVLARARRSATAGEEKSTLNFDVLASWQQGIQQLGLFFFACVLARASTPAWACLTARGDERAASGEATKQHLSAATCMFLERAASLLSFFHRLLTISCARYWMYFLVLLNRLLNGCASIACALSGHALVDRRRAALTLARRTALSQ